MDQKKYSDYILNGLLIGFPQFIDYYTIIEDIVKIEYPSKAGLLKLWITTQDMELTIGLEGNEPKWDWHTHISQFSAYEPEDELREAIKLIKNILVDNETIAFSSSLGYYLTYNQFEDMKNKRSDEVLEFKKWSEL